MERQRMFGSLIYARNKNMSYKKEGVLANSTMSVEFGIKDNDLDHVWIGAAGTFTQTECDAFNGTKKKVVKKKVVKKKVVKKKETNKWINKLKAKLS